MIGKPPNQMMRMTSMVASHAPRKPFSKRQIGKQAQIVRRCAGASPRTGARAFARQFHVRIQNSQRQHANGASGKGFAALRTTREHGFHFGQPLVGIAFVPSETQRRRTVVATSVQLRWNGRHDIRIHGSRAPSLGLRDTTSGVVAGFRSTGWKRIGCILCLESTKQFRSVYIKHGAALPHLPGVEQASVRVYPFGADLSFDRPIGR